MVKNVVELGLESFKEAKPYLDLKIKSLLENTFNRNSEIKELIHSEKILKTSQKPLMDNFYSIRLIQRKSSEINYLNMEIFNRFFIHESETNYSRQILTFLMTLRGEDMRKALSLNSYEKNIEIIIGRYFNEPYIIRKTTVEMILMLSVTIYLDLIINFNFDELIQGKVTMFDSPKTKEDERNSLDINKNETVKFLENMRLVSEIDINEYFKPKMFDNPFVMIKESDIAKMMESSLKDIEEYLKDNDVPDYYFTVYTNTLMKR